jgi:hypothetical protein
MEDSRDASKPTTAIIEMDSSGLVLTSHTGPTVTAKAKISNVTITGDVEPTGEFLWSEDIGFQAITLPKK